MLTIVGMWAEWTRTPLRMLALALTRARLRASSLARVRIGHYTCALWPLDYCSPDRAKTRREYLPGNALSLSLSLSCSAVEIAPRSVNKPAFMTRNGHARDEGRRFGSATRAVVSSLCLQIGVL